MAAGPPSPAAGSPEPVSSPALAARALPCGGRDRRDEPAGGWGVAARPGEGRVGPCGGRRGGWRRRAAELSRDRPAGTWGKVAPPGQEPPRRAGAPGSLQGWPRARGAAGGRRGDSMAGEARGSGSLETPGSPAHGAVAAKAQCPARGTPWRGDSEVRGDPGPAGRLQGAGPSPRGWEPGSAAPRGAAHSASGTPPGSRRTRARRGVDDPKELWGGARCAAP